MGQKKILPILVFAILLATSYFILPDSGGGGSYVNERLNTLFWLFLLMYTACITYPRQIQPIIIVVVFVTITIKDVKIYMLQNL